MKTGEKRYERAGGVVDPLPEDAPWFVRDYHDYYKTPRGYHPRSGNSTDGWNITGTMSFLNQPILAYASEIESAVMVLHGDAAHSCYMGKDAFAQLRGDNKELVLVPGAVHTDLYDGRRQGCHPLGYVAGVLREVSGIGAGRRIEFPALRRGSRLLWRPAIPTARGCAARTRPQPVRRPDSASKR
ncbi:alpha/beta hydrolase [uncultured Enorma sp.]|uniref:alpha/beta hydrolase n=1 Tax=uncultured Enorma sp. TaxID=1714346 RepID=UPI00265F6B6F|nr:alpha/beta hydrolase [uncultured Enorma sp.]